MPEPEVAGPIAFLAYVGAYGPATVNGFRSWLSRGLIPPRQIRSWIDELGDRLAAVELDGRRPGSRPSTSTTSPPTKPSKTVRLLGGFDQWVLGPGTDDGHVIAPARRADVSRQSGWIAPVVVAGGVVSGTWELDGDEVRVAWFREAGEPPRMKLRGEAARLSGVFERKLGLAITDG